MIKSSACNISREFTMRDWGGGQQASLCSGGEGGEWDLRSGRGWGEVALMVILMMMVVMIVVMVE